MNAKQCITAVLLVVACAAPPPPPPAAPQERHDADLARLRTSAQDADQRTVRREAGRFLERHPRSPAESEVRLMAGTAALELGFLEEAARLVAPLEQAGPDSVRADALILGARADIARGSFEDAAGRLLEAAAAAAQTRRAAQARRMLSELIPLLSASDLAALRGAYPGSPGLDLVYQGALSLATAAGDTAAVRELLELIDSTGTPAPPRDVGRVVPRPAPGPAPASTVPAAIGFLCPLSGRYAQLGREFLRGASTAVAEARLRGMTGIELVVGDTKASPLETRGATLRLIEQEQVAGIVGCVLSSTTIAAALVSQHNMTVLYSPIASEEGISDIGAYVFQAQSDFEAEVCAVARAACRGMQLRRVAVLAPDTQWYRSLVALLRREVEGAGGTLCAADFYEPGTTDFRRNIEYIRQSAPEALFIPSDTEDLILILPQLSFYEFGVQLLGTSAWNSGKLLRMAGRDMEGAVFPAGAGSERAAERYRAAVAAGGDTGEANRFAVAGYDGVRMLIEALSGAAASGRSPREEMERMINMRRHRFIELFEEGGIALSIVRNERVHDYRAPGAAH